MEGLQILTEEPPNAETPLDALGPGPTPLERFYVRCNFPVPHVDPHTWRLEIGGTVRHPRHWSLAELRELPRARRTVTLECAGNGRTLMAPVPSGTPWGVGAVSTATFAGVRLAEVLARAEPRAETAELVFTGADGGEVEPDGAVPYEFNLDLATARDDGPLLAWEMNGAPLPAEHGAPVRLVVPGHYGMRSVKWLVRMAAVAEPFTGHFPTKYRYRGEAGVADETPVGPMRVRSLITSPLDGDRIGREAFVVRGIAWSGAGSVARVEVDAGDGWREAELTEAEDPHAATGWTLPWTPPRAGRHVLRVRATDAAGAIQPEASVWNEGGYGNNVVQRITVEVE